MKKPNLIFATVISLKAVFLFSFCFEFGTWDLGFGTCSAQNVGINTTGAAPADAALLEIGTGAPDTKGLLIPRVALTDVAVYAPLTGTSVTSLVVYSTTSPTNGNGAGYYYWNGSKWLAIPAPTNGPGTSGQVLTSQGTASSPIWATAASGVHDVIIQNKTAAYTIVAGDKGTFIDATSGTWTLSFTAAATLGNGFWFYLRNSGTGDITLDPNAAETIDGLTTFILYPGEARMVLNDGSSLHTMLQHPGRKTFTANGTFVVPPGISGISIDATGGGGGGSSGKRDAAGTGRNGGGGGGGGARLKTQILPPAAGSSVAVTVGAGGTGGAAVTTNSTGGINGTAGGSTSFGSYLTIYGGGYGQDLPGSWAAGGGLGGGSGGIGTPWAGISGYQYDALSGAGAGTGSLGSYNAGRAEWGGGGGGGNNTGNNWLEGKGGGSIFGAAGGGRGGAILTTDAYSDAKAGGGSNSYDVGSGGSPGTTPGGAGGNGADGVNGFGGAGGGGGGPNTGGAAGAGGNGGIPGGGGGGGGASLNGFNSGAGGNGARGEITIYWW